jgi:hypothetical protein
VISDRDVWAAALLLVKRYGDDAMLEASERDHARPHGPELKKKLTSKCEGSMRRCCRKRSHYDPTWMRSSLTTERAVASPSPAGLFSLMPATACETLKTGGSDKFHSHLPIQKCRGAY